MQPGLLLHPRHFAGALLLPAPAVSRNVAQSLRLHSGCPANKVRIPTEGRPEDARKRFLLSEQGVDVTSRVYREVYSQPCSVHGDDRCIQDLLGQDGAFNDREAGI